jgi:GT2 family glycosyltransferase/SAM-dependent methyltransferase
LISIIIPTLNNVKDIDKKKALFLETLQSIKNTVKNRYEVIVVVNGMTSLEYIDFIEHSGLINTKVFVSVNTGVARGWNLGANAAVGSYLCFMNDDVVLGAGCIDKMYDLLIKDRSIGMIGPQGAYYKNVNQEFKHIAYVKNSYPTECDAISGFLFITPRGVYDLLGGFDIKYSPASFEEIDYSFNVKNKGFKNIVYPNLMYRHDWGVSAKSSHTVIRYLGKVEELATINRRNKAYFNWKWVRGRITDFNVPYDNSYFKTNDYHEIMLKERFVCGVKEKPLVVTLVDMIEHSSLISRGEKILDIGCAYGFVVNELVKRGYDAYGIDLSSECVENSPQEIRNRLSIGNAVVYNYVENYKVILLANIFEHLSITESELLIEKLSHHTELIFAIINKSPHDDTHINIRTNYEWIKSFKKYGFIFETNKTGKARYYYKSTTGKSEDWHKDVLIFSKSKIFQSGFLLWISEDVFGGRIKLLLFQAIKRFFSKNNLRLFEKIKC